MNLNNNETIYENGTINTSQTGSTQNVSYGAAIQKLYGDVTELFNREGQLIRAEVNEKVSELKTVGIEIVTAGVVLFVGLLCAAASAIILLDLVTELWVSALVVTAAFLIVGGVLLAAAKKKIANNSFAPTKSIGAISEIRHTLKEKVNEITKH